MKRFFLISILLFLTAALIINCSSSTSTSFGSPYVGTWLLTNINKYEGNIIKKVKMQLDCNENGNFILNMYEGGTWSVMFQGTLSTANGMFTMLITNKNDSGIMTNVNETFQSTHILDNNNLAITAGGDKGPPMAMMFKKTDSSSGWTGTWKSYNTGADSNTDYNRVSHNHIDLTLNDSTKLLTEMISNVRYTNGIVEHLSVDNWVGYYNFISYNRMVAVITQTNGYTLAMPMSFTNSYKIITKNGIQHLCMPGPWIKQ